ncbi:MAG: acyl-CoA thioesterase II [Actinobacteria bacterium]|nr:acyl-CoA thioesterase II [Actinomycetota bacterium]
MADLASFLELEMLDRDLFRASTEPVVNSRQSLFGGQVAGQALLAAGSTVAPERMPHSLHGYFLRPGKVDRPVLFHVDRDRDGGSFSARHVRAVQDGDVIFSMLASFAAPEDGVAYDALPTRDGGDPEALRNRPTALLIDVREVTKTRIGGGQIRHSDRLWVRAVGELSDDPLMHACVVTYMSDLGSGFGQVEVEGLPAGGPSIDHSVWFHAPIRADQWTLLELWPLKAGSARGVYHGSMRSQSGELGAVFAQEMLLRHQLLPPDLLERMAEFLGVDTSE